MTCMDCNRTMVRAKDPIMKQAPHHIISRCPNCNLEIQNYENTYLILEDGKVSIGTKWNMTIEQKKLIIAEQIKEKELRERWEHEEEKFNKMLWDEEKK